MSCVIMGDSIAVGTQLFYKECLLLGKSGITSQQWNNLYKINNISVDTVVISLGTNDHKNIDTKKELLKIRQQIISKNVIWILPPINTFFIQNIVRHIAFMYNDKIVEIQFLQNDKIHPTPNGYKQIVKEIKEQ